MQELITNKVKDFYGILPFNFSSNTEQRIKRIKSNPIKNNYPDLHEMLYKTGISTALEIGCGTGWLANTIAYNYVTSVVGIDLCNKALSSANEISNLLNLTEKVKYYEVDLFKFTPDIQFDLLISLGVLHHTFDAKAAFYSIEGLLRKNGFLYIGLYHKPGREVFIKMFNNIIETKGLDYAFDLFMTMNPKNAKEMQFQLSWFRDQVCHVHETSHTFKEVSEWLQEKNFSILSTSINKFKKINNLQDIIDLESSFEEISFKRNYIQKKYYPGFFTVLAKKN